MNKDTLKGKAKDAMGRAERQVGEWTDDPKLQGEGAARQVEGKLQKGVGKVKDAGREARDKMEEMRRRGEHEAERHEDIRHEDIKKDRDRKVA